MTLPPDSEALKQSGETQATTYAQQIRKHGLAATINQGVHAVQHERNQK